MTTILEGERTKGGVFFCGFPMPINLRVEEESIMV